MKDEQIVDRLQLISGQIARLQVEFLELKEHLRNRRRRHINGHDGTVTIYTVNETVVRKHTRRSFTAVRVSARRRK